MYTDQNLKIIEEMEKRYRFGKQSKKNYMQHLQLYSKFHNMSLEELLNEAEDEEEARIRKRKRKINQRLFDFQDYLINEPYEFKVNGKVRKGRYENSSINTILRSVVTFYRTFEIETPNVRISLPVQAEKEEDTITYEMIQKALDNTTNLRHIAIIKLMASTGLDSNDVCSMTVQTFIDGCQEYLTTDTLQEQLQEILDNENIIPCFRFQRGKTRYDHFTFCTPDSAHSIAEYLLSLGEVNYGDNLFQIGIPSYRKLFSNLNDKCGFGFTSKGTRRKFHSHGLRRFLASQLVGSTVNGMMIDTMVIEWFLGHKVPSTMESYYKRNPQKLKDIYIHFIPKLSFDGETRVNTVDSPEYMRLKDELQQYKNLIGDVTEIRKLKEELLEQYNNIS